MQELKMPLWRAFLRPSTAVPDTGEIQVIDATGESPSQANHHDATWTEYPFKAVKSIALIDCKFRCDSIYALLTLDPSNR